MSAALPASASRRLVSVQALRAVAALLVVGAHLAGSGGTLDKTTGSPGPFWVIGDLGGLGVDLFFVVSGVMMVAITRGYDRGPALAGSFLLRRLARLYPAYFVVTAAAFALWAYNPGLVNSSQAIGPDPVASFLLLPQAGLPLVLVAWTLVYDLLFYLVFAVSLLLRQPRLRLVFLAGWAVFLASYWATMPYPTGPYLVLVTSPLALQLIAGAALGWIITERHHLPAPALALATGAAAAVGAVFVYGPALDAPAHGEMLRAAILGPAMAAVCYGAIGLERRRRTALPFLVAVGNWSYSIYLLHIFALAAFARVLGDHLDGGGLAAQVVVAVAGAAVAIGSGWVLHVLVERPGIRHLHDRVPRPPKRAQPQPQPAPHYLTGNA